MMMKKWFNPLAATATFILLSAMSSPPAGKNEVPTDTRCPVCGMFVAKYPAWIVTFRHQSGTIHHFDGVKDMMAYYYSPTKFGGKENDPVLEIKVKDYYTLAWIDGKKAFYVTGSDVFGPMGHEFIPFASRAAAENFLKDHEGKKILTFAEIDSDLVETLRSGQTMK